MNHAIRATLVATMLLLAGIVRTEPLAAEDLRRAVETNVGAAVALYRDFLGLPNDALHPDEIETLVTWMEEKFGSRGFDTRRIPTDGSPALFAERSRDGAGKTVLVYLQADGQPVDPRAWAQANPYMPVLKARSDDGSWQEIPWASIDEGYDPDWRVFARSAADSKGPMTQFMMAIQLLDELGVSLKWPTYREGLKGLLSPESPPEQR